MARDAGLMHGMQSTDKATRQWRILFTTCFRRRIRADQVSDAFRELSKSEPIPGVRIASIIFTSGAHSSTGVDPLIAAYLEQVLHVTNVDICDVLMALLSQSQYALKKSGNHEATEDLPTDSSMLQESVFTLLVRLFTGSEQPKTAKESRRITRALVEWVAACNCRETVLQVQSAGLRAPEARVIAAFEALGTLIYAVFSHGSVRDDLLKAWSKGGWLVFDELTHTTDRRARFES